MGLKGRFPSFVTTILSLALVHTSAANAYPCRKSTAVAKPPKLEAHCNKTAAVGDTKVCRINDDDYIEIYGKKGEILGMVKAALPGPKDDAIAVSMYQVSEKARGQGISTRLFKKILELAPHTKYVYGQMAHTNFEVIMNKYCELNNVSPPLSEEEKNNLIAVEPPFYKSWASLGFSKIHKFSMEWVTINGPPYVSMIDLTVKRP